MACERGEEQRAGSTAHLISALGSMSMMSCPPPPPSSSCSSASPASSSLAAFLVNRMGAGGA